MYKSTDFFWNSAAKIIVMQIEGFQIRQVFSSKLGSPSSAVSLFFTSAYDRSDLNKVLTYEVSTRFWTTFSPSDYSVAMLSLVYVLGVNYMRGDVKS